jgi:hypothetical protein
MEDHPMHILTKAGVLASFSISKKITEQEIDAMMALAKRKGKSEDDVVNMVKNKIMKEIVDATQKGTLPGILLDNIKPPLISIQSIESLNRMVMVLSQKLKEKKFDKLSLCYFINYLVGSLQLTEEDFEDFHRRLRDAKERNGDEEDDEED